MIPQKRSAKNKDIKRATVPPIILLPDTCEKVKKEVRKTEDKKIIKANARSGSTKKIIPKVILQSISVVARAGKKFLRLSWCLGFIAIFYTLGFLLLSSFVVECGQLKTGKSFLLYGRHVERLVKSMRENRRKVERMYWITECPDSTKRCSRFDKERPYSDGCHSHESSARYSDRVD